MAINIKAKAISFLEGGRKGKKKRERRK